MKKRILFCITIVLSLSILSSVSAWALNGNFNRVSEYTQPTDWYYDGIKFIVEENLMPRPNAKKFIPREVAVSLLSRYDGHIETTDYEYYYDIPSVGCVDGYDGAWTTPGVNWAYENGITNGTGGSYFTGSRVITREEFVTLLYRYTAYRGYERDTSRDISAYPDSAEISDFAADAMKWAVGCGLITGKPGGLLAPKDTITRAEVALIMYRYNDVVPHLDEAIR